MLFEWCLIKYSLFDNNTCRNSMVVSIIYSYFIITCTFLFNYFYVANVTNYVFFFRQNNDIPPWGKKLLTNMIDIQLLTTENNNLLKQLISRQEKSATQQTIQLANKPMPASTPEQLDLLCRQPGIVSKCNNISNITL